MLHCVLKRIFFVFISSISEYFSLLTSADLNSGLWLFSVYFYLKFLPVCSAAEVSPRRRTGMSCFPACAGAWPGLWCGYPSRGPAGAGTPAGWPGTAPCGRRFPSHPCHLCRSGRCTTAWRTLEGRRDKSVQKSALYLYDWNLFESEFKQSGRQRFRYFHI